MSFNCNGLSDIFKLQKVFSNFEEKKIDIVFLQETFWTGTFIYQVRDKWNGSVFYSNGNNGRQGVAILLSSNFKNTCNIVSNFGSQGRFLHMQLEMDNNTLNLFNVYAPNVLADKVDFFNFINNYIHDGSYDNVMIAGDFNTTLAKIDRSGATQHLNDLGVKAPLRFRNNKIMKI